MMFGVFKDKRLLTIFHDRKEADKAIEGTDWEVLPVVELKSKMVIAENTALDNVKKTCTVLMTVLATVTAIYVVARDVQHEKSLDQMKEVIMGHEAQLDELFDSVLVNKTVKHEMH